MENFNNDEVQKMLDMLKEKADSISTEQQVDAQTPEKTDHTADDITDMLKKQFSAAQTESAVISDDYSFDTDDFSLTGEISAEENVEEVIEEAVKENIEEYIDITAEDSFEEPIEKIVEKTTEEIIEYSSAEIIKEEADQIAEEFEKQVIEEVAEEIIEEPIFSKKETVFEAPEKTEQIEIITEETAPIERAVDEVMCETDELIEETVKEIEDEIRDEHTRAFGVSDMPIYEATVAFDPLKTAAFESVPAIAVEEIEENKENNVESNIESNIESNDRAISEESINFDEVLEGQQGTVFNNFVEDFTGDLDDVVFEAEITESRAPEKQYTIFEDWEQLMKDKQYETAEEGIIPPTAEELAYSAEIAAKAANGHTDYFTPITPDSNLDAVDIALMVALGAEDEIDQTVGFEKIRQAVDSQDDRNSAINPDKSVYGFCGEEYTSIIQAGKIKKKYKSDKIKLLFKTIITAIIALVLICYEIVSWRGVAFSEMLKIGEKTIPVNMVIGLLLLLIAIAVSGSKLIPLFKNMLELSSISYIGAILLSALSILNDILIVFIDDYAHYGATVHSLAAILLLISLIYDVFDVYHQSSVFDIVSRTNKKLVLEPYGKLRMNEDESDGDIIDKDSYCISRVSNVNGFFERMSRNAKNATGKLVSLVLSFSVSLCVMLVLLLRHAEIGTIVLSLVVTLSFSLICASVFDSEFAFFTVNRILKKYKTGIIGKASIEEYGKSNIVYFDDFNVFNKKSVRTKGLKLYDNNEIYKILYHTQAVFSKVGGPLKGVFEFATAEMAHSKSVEIKEISKEGICAVVDNRTTVLIGSGSFMKMRGIHPRYTSADLKLEEVGEESILFIALGGSLGAKLYVTYSFSSEFERLAKKLTACGIGIGIRSADPNINDKWAKTYGAAKRCAISVVRPNIKELKPKDKTIESGVVSIKNVRALSEAVMMCTRLYSFESFIAKVRIAAIIFIAVLTFILITISNGVNVGCMLLLLLTCAFGASVMMLLSHFYIKR